MYVIVSTRYSEMTAMSHASGEWWTVKGHW